MPSSSSLKIFGTFGPKTRDYATLLAMVKAGMNGIRLNTNHKKLEEAKEWIEAWNKACKEQDIQGELLIDLKGRALRVGILEKPLFLERGDRIDIERLNLEEPVFENGDHLLIDDGKMEALYQDGTLEILREGMLLSGKNITLLNRRIEKLALSPIDLKELKLAKEYGVSSIMIPFVQDREDLLRIRHFLDRHDLSFRLYAKIENNKGIENLKEIMEAADEIVIARGDLANSIGLLQIGLAQDLITKACKKEGKDYMVVTQMLDSMQSHPFPTRAEVLDVFSAVYNGAASIMLTNETAAGDYPIEAMQAFCQIAKEAKEYRENPQAAKEKLLAQ